MHLLLLGVNHRTAPLEAREALAFSPGETVVVLTDLMRAGLVQEAALLSTCNRTEFYIVTGTPEVAEEHLRAAVARFRGRDLLAPGDHRYVRLDREVVRHLLRVACGLESMVLGDVQILGQVKDALALARQADASGLRLDRLFEVALRAGKRARTESAISAGVVSVASAAADLLRHELTSLEGRHLVVVGAGETGRLAARHLSKEHPASLTLVNRSVGGADAVSRELGCPATVLPLSRLGEALARADAVVTATRAPGFVVTGAIVAEAMRKRPERPLLLVDIAVPRDVEPSAGDVPGVTLHAIDAIQQVVDTTKARRAAEVPTVEAIVEQEAAKFEAWQRSHSAAPVVRELRDHFERVRAEEVERALRSASEEERERVERVTRALINRLLHTPTLQLKDADPESATGLARLRAARELFALGAGEPEVPHEG